MYIVESYANIMTIFLLISVYGVHGWRQNSRFTLLLLLLLVVNIMCEVINVVQSLVNEGLDVAMCKWDFYSARE